MARGWGMGEHGQRSMTVASCSPHDFSHQHDGESQKEVVLREGRGDAGHFIGKDLLPGHGSVARQPWGHRKAPSLTHT